MIYDGTGPVEAGTSWYLVVLGQKKAVPGQYKAVGSKVFGGQVEKV